MLFLQIGAHSPLQSKEPKRSEQTSACHHMRTHKQHTHTHTHTERQRVNTITGRDEISKITGNNSPECLQKNNVYIIYNFHFTLILTALIELK